MKRRAASAVGLFLAASAALPATVAAHALHERYQAPLPLIVYVIGAAIAVAMSFAFVVLRNPRPPAERRVGAIRTVPAWLRLGLRLIGIAGWAWIVLQTFVGGSGEADVASLFLWVYGWVGLGLVSALLGPAWSWLDPFSTIHDALAWLGRRLRMSWSAPRQYPAGWGSWPAVIGFAFFVWLELVARAEGGRTLGLVLIGYTIVTLTGMAYFGRDGWRRQTEVFSVWFGLLGRLAPYALASQPADGRVVRRPFASDLSGGWTGAHLVLIGLGTGSIIFDGLSQTQLYFDLFGGLSLLGQPLLVPSLVLIGFMALLIGVILIVARGIGADAVGAGLLPVAIGYLVAHYLTFLLVDGQRIVNALNDPLQRGDNLLPFDLGFFEPALFLPTAIVWTIQLAAVVGGHIVGAWAGHNALIEATGRAEPRAQLPLAALMVVLTSLTLWSLGQAVIVEDETSDVRDAIQLAAR